MPTHCCQIVGGFDRGKTPCKRARSALLQVPSAVALHALAIAQQPRLAAARGWEEVWAAAQQLIAAKLQEPSIAGGADLQVISRSGSVCDSLHLYCKFSYRRIAYRFACHPGIGNVDQMHQGMG